MINIHASVIMTATLLIAPVALATDIECTAFKRKKPVVVTLDPATVYIVDGDTIRERDECAALWRLSDIDAPETELQKIERQPERDLGIKATARLTILVRRAKTVEFRYSGKPGGHNRPSGKLMVDGRSAGSILKSEGLACQNSQEMKHDWCATPPRCLAQPKHAEP